MSVAMLRRRGLLDANVHAKFSVGLEVSGALG